MESKIAELTDKIFKEGVEKGEQQARQLVDDAKATAAKIIEEAKKEAGGITDNAAAKAEELRRNVASEIKLSGQQALNAIKQQILDVVTAKAIDSGLAKTLDDPAMLKEMILALIHAWQAGSGEALSLDVLLPEAKKADLEKALVHSIQKALKDGVRVSFSRNLKGGFQVGPSDGSFRVSLSDEDFSEFFKEFARPKAKAYLFGEEG